MNQKFRFNRVLLKISGEALKGAQDHGYDAEAVRKVVRQVKKIMDQGVEVALVVGAGNIWRGVMGRSGGMDRVNADYMGMLATVMNALCLRDFFRAAGIQAVVQCSIGMEPIAPRFNRDEAIRALEAGKIVIFAGGTGSPFFTTDTTAALRALDVPARIDVDWDAPDAPTAAFAAYLMRRAARPLTEDGLRLVVETLRLLWQDEAHVRAGLPALRARAAACLRVGEDSGFFLSGALLAGWMNGLCATKTD